MRRQLRMDRLEDAKKASKFPDNAHLERASGVSHSVLSRIISGESKKANPATVRSLADALRVPAEWLTGQTDELPHVNNRSLLTGRKIDPPTEGMIRRSWLLQRVEDSVRRDLQRWFGPAANHAYDSWGRWILRAVEQLASPYEWRCAAIVPNGNPIVYLRERNTTPRRRSRYLADEAVPIAWVEQMLEPWFADVATLNSDTLGRLLEALFLNLRRSEVYPPGARKVLDKQDADTLEAVTLYGAIVEGAKAKRAKVQNAATLAKLGVAATGDGRQ